MTTYYQQNKLYLKTKSILYYNSLVKDDVYYADKKVYSAVYYQLHKDDIRERQHCS